MPSSGNRPDRDRPEYNVYRSRRGLFSRFRKPDLESLSGKEKRAADRQRAARSDRQDLPYEVHRSGSPGDRRRARSSEPRSRLGRGGSGSRGGGKRWLKWILIACFGWLVISFLAFGISAQIQSMKLSGDAKDALGGSPWILTSPQNILIIGTDSRPPDTLEPGAAQDQRCYDQQAQGEAPHDGCAGARADTLMVVRAGGGKFKKLGIPRDSYAAIPGQDTQKINAAYAFGGAALQVKTVEDFLGISIDHVVILNFTGFEDFIDAIGGVKVDVPVRLCADISGGKKNGGWTIDLKAGSKNLDRETDLASPPPPKAESLPGQPAERLLGWLRRSRPGRRPTTGHERDQAAPDRPAAAALQLHQGPDHRLDRTQGFCLGHGFLHPPPARSLDCLRWIFQAGCPDPLRARPGWQPGDPGVRTSTRRERPGKLTPSPARSEKLAIIANFSQLVSYGPRASAVPVGQSDPEEPEAALEPESPDLDAESEEFDDDPESELPDSFLLDSAAAFALLDLRVP